MEYISLYRKFRPLKFSEIVGQDHITQTLRNEIIAERMIFFLLSCASFTKFTMFSSAFLRYSYSDTFSADSSSFTDIFNSLHNGSNRETSGNPFPRSHFEIVLSLIPSMSASYLWV